MLLSLICVALRRLFRAVAPSGGDDLGQGRRALGLAAPSAAGTQVGKGLILPSVELTACAGRRGASDRAERALVDVPGLSGNAASLTPGVGPPQVVPPAGWSRRILAGAACASVASV